MNFSEKYQSILANLLTDPPENNNYNFKKSGPAESSKFIYDLVVSNIAQAKKEGRIAAGEDLNALGITSQILFETGYGTSELSSKYNNFGGLRAGGSWKGQTVNMLNKGTGKNYNWRAYPTVNDGLKAQVDFYIDNKRYRKNGVFTAKTPQDHLNAVAKAGYAGGESDYVSKVTQVLNTLPKKLSTYDPTILKQWEQYVAVDKANADNSSAKFNAQPEEVQMPSLPTQKPYFDKGLGLTTEIDKNHEVIKALQNSVPSEYLEKQINAIEKPLFESLLKPLKFS